MGRFCRAPIFEFKSVRCAKALERWHVYMGLYGSVERRVLIFQSIYLKTENWYDHFDLTLLISAKYSLVLQFLMFYISKIKPVTLVVSSKQNTTQLAVESTEQLSCCRLQLAVVVCEKWRMRKQLSLKLNLTMLWFKVRGVEYPLQTTPTGRRPWVT